MAQLTDDEKNSISHRGKVLANLHDFLIGGNKMPYLFWLKYSEYMIYYILFVFSGCSAAWFSACLLYTSWKYHLFRRYSQISIRAKRIKSGKIFCLEDSEVPAFGKCKDDSDCLQYFHSRCIKWYSERNLRSCNRCYWTGGKGRSQRYRIKKSRSDCDKGNLSLIHI